MTTYERELNKILDDVYDAWDLSWPDLARAAKLSESTVYRIMDRKTKLPRFLTVWQLARACGFELRMVRVQRMKKVA